MVGRAIRPVRRFAAWFTLADERAATPAQPSTNGRSSGTGRDRRLEEADARAATEIQRLAEELRRVTAENAAIVRLVTQPERSPTEVPAAGLMKELARGPRAEVMRKFGLYKELIRDRAPVVDLGCGQGEFLELAEWVDIAAYGVDTSAEAVEHCRRLGLDAREEDPVQHLAALPEGSLGGVFCAQVVEYLGSEALKEMINAASSALKPGGILIVETLNPGSLSAMRGFWSDPARRRPVSAEELSLLARTAGLVVERIVHSPDPQSAGLRPVEVASSQSEIAGLAAEVNRIVAELNDILYGSHSYTLVAFKPDEG
jgi:SAM-dependent methyltransferase